MNTYGARPEVIAIPVDEYKELLAAFITSWKAALLPRKSTHFTSSFRTCMMRCIRWNWTLKLLPLSFRAWLNLWRRCTRKERRG